MRNNAILKQLIEANPRLQFGGASFTPVEEFIITAVFSAKRLTLTRLHRMFTSRAQLLRRAAPSRHTIRARINTINNRARLWSLGWRINTVRIADDTELTWEVMK